MPKHLFLPILASLLLAACATKPAGPTSPQIGDVAPTGLPTECQPTVKALSIGEPLPPAGIDPQRFYGMLVDSFGEEKAKEWWKWFTTTYPGWAREGWTRLDAARQLPPCNS